VSFRRLDDGWEVRWRENGRHRSRRFDRRRDAHSWDAEVRRRRQLGALALAQLTTAAPTLDQWIEQCWAPEHAATLERSTRERYANVYARHIAGPLGDVPLSELTVARVRAWQARMLKSGIKPGTVHKARTVLSSVLRHAAEAEAIAGNPLGVIRAPRASQRDAVNPLAPSTVEAVRQALLYPQPREVPASREGQRRRRRYELPAPGATLTRRRDALIVSLLAYAGLRPGELRGLRWGDVRENTILVERAADPHGSIKPTKNRTRRSVRLLAPLAQEVRESRLAMGRPSDATLILLGDAGRPWGKANWNMWARDRWAPACRSVGLDHVPRPYDLRHGFASLLLAEGRQQLYVARQLGHSLAVLTSTYAHLIDEFEEGSKVDAELVIAQARGAKCTATVRSSPQPDATRGASS
jgi:integrase